MRTYPQKLIRRCDVTAILVLYGLPRYIILQMLTLFDSDSKMQTANTEEGCGQLRDY